MRKQIIIFCDHYRKELETLNLTAEHPDVQVLFFSGRCGRPPISWEKLKESLPVDLQDVAIHVVSGGCIKDLPEEHQKIYSFNKIERKHCIHLITSPSLAAFYADKGYYMITPGWLQRWREIIDQWGFDQKTARDFFRDTARAILLLDTGVDDNALDHLSQFSAFAGLPSETVTTGLDYLQLLVNNAILQSRLADNQEQSGCEIYDNRRERADFMMAFDLLNLLIRVREENDVIDGIREMFTMLFAPREIVFQNSREGAASSESIEDTEPADGFILPVSGSTDILGKLCIKGLSFPKYKDQYKNLASRMVGICGLAIENARYYKKIKDLSDIDGLTRIANRRKLEEHMTQEWRRMRRAKKPLSLIMADIDYFKNYNDRYGHQAGDDCLKAVARVLAEHCSRPGDMAARYGGEEFTLVLSDTDLEGAASLAEQIRHAVEALNIRHEDSIAGDHVTVSFGIASAVPNHGFTIEDLLLAADRSLFDAKKHGRNRIVAAALASTPS